MRTPRRLLLVLVLTAIAGASAPGPGAATLPSIYVQYADDCSVGVTVDGGIIVSPAPTPAVIPPGQYQVVLRAPENSAACAISFQLSGPGVQLLFDFGGEGLNDQATETLLPGSTYVALDLNEPARTRAAFSTASTGSSSTLVTQSASTATGHGQASTDLVGSARPVYRGALAVTVGPGGAVALTARGKPVTTLEEGRYDLKVDDRTAKRGLSVQKLHGHPVALTGAAFVGRRTRRVALTPGAWLLYSSFARPFRIVVSA
jgi:hypothetical protein